MTPPAALDVTITVSEPRPAWCRACKAYTGATVDVHALMPAGVVHVTTLTVCEVCDDPEDPHV